MEFYAKMRLETEITSNQITELFERDSQLRQRYNMERRNIENDLLDSIAEVQNFLKENSLVREFDISEVKHAFEIRLKFAIIKEAEKELLSSGESNLRDVITATFLNKETIRRTTIEAYLLLFTVEVYNSSYVSVREAMQKLEGLKKSI